MPIESTVLNLNGQERRLRLTINALTEVERIVGKPFSAVIRDMQFMDFTVLRALLWAGMGDPKLSLTQVGAEMEAHLEAGGSLESIYEGIDRAVATSAVLKGVKAGPQETKVTST